MLEEVSDMSENCRYYRAKMEAKRSRVACELHEQWVELMRVVWRCEHIWTVEDRIERSL
jgi:hypothetical protein